MNKEALASCTPVHSSCPPSIARGSLLKNCNANNSNRTNYSTQVNKLSNDLLAWGCTKKGIVDVFEEAELKIIEISKRNINNQNIGHKSTLEEVLKSMKPSNEGNLNKDTKGTALLHLTHHPKDMSRKRLQKMSNEICKEKFEDRLNTDECMIACHNPDNMRRLTTLSSLKKCGGMENSANYHADEAGIDMMDNGM